MFCSWFACSRSRCCFVVGGRWPQSVCLGSLTHIITIRLHVFSMFWNKTLITFYISLCDEPYVLDSLLTMIKHLRKCITQRITQRETLPAVSWRFCSIAQPKADKCPSSASHLPPFICCLSVVLYLDKGDYPENSHVVFCPDKLRSFEPFMCLDFIGYVKRCVLTTKQSPALWPKISTTESDSCWSQTPSTGYDILSQTE